MESVYLTEIKVLSRLYSFCRLEGRFYSLAFSVSRGFRPSLASSPTSFLPLLLSLHMPPSYKNSPDYILDIQDNITISVSLNYLCGQSPFCLGYTLQGSLFYQTQ